MCVYAKEREEIKKLKIKKKLKYAFSLNYLCGLAISHEPLPMGLCI